MLALLIGISCSSTPTDWSAEFAADSSATLQKINSLPNVVERESILLSLLSTSPQQAPSICAEVSSETAKSKCSRFQNRPHLWSIELHQIPYWNGGSLTERLAFPRTFQIQDVPEYEDQCDGNPLCYQARAEERVFIDWKEGLYNCNQIAEARSRQDCTFHLSETLPVHLDNYLPAVTLCAASKSFSAECHNHLLLRFASSFWTNAEWHQQLLERFSEVWTSADYVRELTDAYWSIVAFRVVGMMMPLQVMEFSEFPPEFKPYLHSGIALRAWDEADPIQTVQRALRGEALRLPKARGPNAPRFAPKQLWDNRTATNRWIRFCDIRGGHRPTHFDDDIDVVWALLTASAMAKPARVDYWENLLQEPWEVRWAMAHLLRKTSPEHPLLESLKKDDDHRVQRAVGR